MNKKIISIVIILIIAVGLIAGGIILFQNKNTNKEQIPTQIDKKLNIPESKTSTTTYYKTKLDDRLASAIISWSMPIVININDKNTENWKTYTDKEFGFSFRYPDEWNPARSSDDPSNYTKARKINAITIKGYNNLRVGVQLFNKTPDEIKGMDTVVLYEKEYLINMKQQMIDDKNAIKRGDFTITKHIGHDISGDSFYVQARFFSGNDLIKLSIPIYIGPTPAATPDNKEKMLFIEKEVKKIKNGQAIDRVKKELEQFDLIISTLMSTK